MSGIFLNILLSINMFKYLLDHSHVIHPQETGFQLLHCGSTLSGQFIRQQNILHKEENKFRKHGGMKTSVTTAKLHSKGNRNMILPSQS